MDPVPMHRWSRTSEATGVWPKCSYSLQVKANSTFGLRLSGRGAPTCGGFDLDVSPKTPLAFRTVGADTVTNANIQVSSLRCF
jgi:hypothetical protein